ncbi:MAG: nucleoside-diphosphate-sugar epimerase [Proteobacteria bacterium]|nr:nucleoside-diphosphate-sugar epimerase [Pseudomonadota bacterium]
MRCCVIGGAGFIGRYLTKELRATGRDVVVLGRRPIPSPAMLQGVDYVSCDYGNRESLKGVLQDCQEVIDLAYATVPQTSFVAPLFDLQANLPPCIGLMEVLRELDGLRRAMIVSSGGTVYGPADRLPITEEMTTSPVSPYGITKLTIERYALMFHRLHGVPVNIVRPANAYGVGQKPFSGQGFIATAMGHIARGEDVLVFGENGTIRDYVHVSDVARGIVAALERGADGDTYNIGSGVGRSNRQVLDAIEPFSTAAGLRIGIRNEPERKFDVAANVLNFGRLLACSGWLPQVTFERGIEELWAEIYSAKKHG